MSNEWANGEISSYSDTKQKQQTSLCKKFDNKESVGHKTVMNILLECKKERLQKIILKQCSHEKEATEKIFQTA